MGRCFDASLMLRDPIAAADVVGDATPELMRSGRSETIERWLAACDDGARRRLEPLLREQPSCSMPGVSHLHEAWRWTPPVWRKRAANRRPARSTWQGRRLLPSGISPSHSDYT